MQIRLLAQHHPQLSRRTLSFQLFTLMHRRNLNRLKGLDATVVTVGVNVGGYSGATLDAHFREVASDPSLYLKIADINDGSVLQAMITDLLSKACTLKN